MEVTTMESRKKHDAPKTDDTFKFRMGLNDNKAGMEGLDKEKINKIIMEATKGSRFYENELKKDEQVNQRIEKMMQQKSQVTSQQLKNAEMQVDQLAMEMEQRRDLSRFIVHIDMDAFYAAVEMRENPELRDKPLAVGSMSMLSTSNYLARRFGVRAAMPGFIGKKLCPNLIIVPSNFDKYRDVSKEVREVLADYDPNFLPMSLDEAYLDLTEHLKERKHWPEDKRTHFMRREHTSENGETEERSPEVSQEALPTSSVLFEDSPPSLPEGSVPSCPAGQGELLSNKAVIFGTSVEEAVREMRFRIEQKTALTASAGIAPNMILAKVCSDKNKPNGQYRIPGNRQAVVAFIRDLPIRKVPGIGKVTEKMLKALGITSCTDLYQQRALLALLFSETSWHNFLHISMGLGSTHIERDGERKSMSTERTFSEMWKAEEQYNLCQELCSDLAQDLLKEGLKGKTVTLKVKNVKFEVKTRAFSVLSSVSTEEEIFAIAKDLLRTEIESVSPQPLRLRLMGVRVSGFLSDEEKKHQQISIINFLQVRNPTNAVFLPLQNNTTAQTQCTPTSALVSKSFFNKKRAVRQQTSLEGSLNITGEQKLKCLKITEAAVMAETSKSQNSGKCQSLTCPVCFQKQETTNLDAFNRHIDKCLSYQPLNEEGDEVEDTVKKKSEGLLYDSIEPVKEHCTASTENNIFAVHQKNEMNRLVDVMHSCSNGNSEVHENLIAVGKTKAIPGEQKEAVVSSICGTTVHNIAILQNFSMPEVPIAKEEGCKRMEDLQEPWRYNSSTISEDMSLTCPVCSLEQRTTDLAVFNNHVDMCLNKGLIQELKKERMCPLSNNNVENAHSAGVFRGGQQDSGNTVARTKRPGSSAHQPAFKKSKPSTMKNTIDKFFS